MVNRATVRVGPFSGIVVSSFRFGFDALKTEYPQTAHTELLIDSPKPTYRCSECDHIFSHHSVVPSPLESIICPACGSQICFPEGGDELILQQLEME